MPKPVADPDDISLSDLDLDAPLDIDLGDDPPPVVPRRRSRKPKELRGLTPRHRRTKAQMAAERAAVAFAALMAEAVPACEAAIARATPGQRYIANKIVKRWLR